MVKQIILAIMLTTVGSSAYAACGHTLRVTLEADEQNTKGFNDRDFRNSHVYRGQDMPYGMGDQQTDTFNRNDRYDYGVNVQWTIPLGEDYCEEQELAKLRRDRELARRDKAYAERAEIDNIEKLLRLCTTHGKDNPHLAGKCK